MSSYRDSADNILNNKLSEMDERKKPTKEYDYNSEPSQTKNNKVPPNNKEDSSYAVSSDGGSRGSVAMESCYSSEFPDSLPRSQSDKETSSAAKYNAVNYYGKSIESTPPLKKTISETTYSSSWKPQKVTSFQEDKIALETLSLEKKRKIYSCRKFNTLDDIETWTEYQKNHSFQLSKYPPSNSQKKLGEELEVNASLNDKVSLFIGDITSLEIDCIVNAANSSLLGGGGVDGAIHRAAGSSLLKECRTLGGCHTGGAKISYGYKLPAKNIIHTVGPMDGNPSHLASCYRMSLELAQDKGLRSIAFPCISTGVYGFPNDYAAEIVLEITRVYLEENPDSFDRIIFCLFMKEDIYLYNQLIQILFPTSNKMQENKSRRDVPNLKEESISDYDKHFKSGSSGAKKRVRDSTVPMDVNHPNESVEHASGTGHSQKVDSGNSSTYDIWNIQNKDDAKYTDAGNSRDKGKSIDADNSRNVKKSTYTGNFHDTSKSRDSANSPYAEKSIHPDSNTKKDRNAGFSHAGKPGSINSPTDIDLASDVDHAVGRKDDDAISYRRQQHGGASSRSKQPTSPQQQMAVDDGENVNITEHGKKNKKNKNQKHAGGILRLWLRWLVVGLLVVALVAAVWLYYVTNYVISRGEDREWHEEPTPLKQQTMQL